MVVLAQTRTTLLHAIKIWNVATFHFRPKKLSLQLDANSPVSPTFDLAVLVVLFREGRVLHTADTTPRLHQSIHLQGHKASSFTRAKFFSSSRNGMLVQTTIDADGSRRGTEME